MKKILDASGKPLPREEAPDAKLLRAYGDAMFLAFRSSYHNRMSVANLRLAFEPPLVLGQYRIFRFDEVPRAIFTWAFLSPEAERKHVQGKPLMPEDWNAEGGRMWVIDLIAPYRKLMPSLWNWAMVPGNVSKDGFRFCRHKTEDRNRKIVDIDFGRSGKTQRILTDKDFS